MKLIFTLQTSVTSKDDDRSLSGNNLARISLEYWYKLPAQSCNRYLESCTLDGPLPPQSVLILCPFTSIEKVLTKKNDCW